MQDIIAEINQQERQKKANQQICTKQEMLPKGWKKGK
jgi:hypothetical protein